MLIIQIFDYVTQCEKARHIQFDTMQNNEDLYMHYAIGGITGPALSYRFSVSLIGIILYF
jgi:hypothetical protein